MQLWSGNQLTVYLVSIYIVVIGQQENRASAGALIITSPLQISTKCRKRVRLWMRRLHKQQLSLVVKGYAIYT